MPRPIKRRDIWFRPDITFFKPRGIPLSSLEEIILTVEEFEAIRLKDFEDLDQEEAAKRMNISQPTFNRILSSARYKIAKALTEGKAIRIEGGVHRFMRGRIRRRGRS